MCSTNTIQKVKKTETQNSQREDTLNLLSKIKTCDSIEFEYDTISRSFDEIKNTIGGNDLPHHYIMLLTTTENMDITGEKEVIHFLSLKDTRHVNYLYAGDLPSFFFFGDDRGERLYAFDPTNAWGKGANAVFLVPKGAMEKKYCRYLAADLPGFLDKICKGDNFQECPKME